MTPAKEIRQQFLDFFKSKGHTAVPSAPSVPHDDPTLMFTNAGMNQFKDVFLGQGTRPYTRATDTQKCIRVSGKHNDLEEVGRDGYHHTFFEMLGNWSFGDYYKKEAITWAWELLTEVWGLDKDRLYITVYTTDDEASQIWTDVTGFTEESRKIQRHDEKDNFWEMGEVGPCGPCTEIHYDRTPNGDGMELVNADHEDVIEIWNNVFIQYNRKQDGSLEELPNKHVDTGMGFERIVSIIQEKKSNYDTDVFSDILAKISELSGVPYESGEKGIPHQVIADHIRMVTIAIADGATPSNEGRGYVVRRILRRAARFARKIGLDSPFLYKILPTMSDVYGEVFPEIPGQEEFITSIIKAEESSFKKNLDRGIKLFDDLSKDLKEGDQISGKDVFVLYDTYGFPADMTAQMAEERGLTADMAAYEQELAEAKERSRATKGNVTADWIVLNECDDTPFLGYTETTSDVQISRYRATGDQDAAGRDIYQVMLTRTPFYGESGGQLGDTGTITGEGFVLEVLDTPKIDGQNVCLSVATAGEINGEAAVASIDVERRENIGRNHTATHLLHQALKDVVGDHVQQKGSLVHPDYLRFDFAHFEGVTAEQLREIETVVNNQILANSNLEVHNKAIDEAKEMGAQALFGEKYGDVVRVVQVGGYSLELCGGTHVNATGDIGFVKIVSESSISAGIRRIEAVTGQKAYDATANMEAILDSIAGPMKAPVAELPERVQTLLDKVKALQKENDQLKQKVLLAEADEMVNDAVEVKGAKVLTKQVSVGDVESLKNLGHSMRDKLGTAVVVLGAEINEKAMIIVAVSDDLVGKGVKAGAIINPVARKVNGGGGGHPRFAQAGGKNPANLPEAIASALDVVTEQLG